MLNYRLATPEDIDLIFKWANDPVTRHNSFNTEKISYKNHINWYNKQIESDENLILIFEIDSIPLGMVRFHKEDDSWTIGINISEAYRGQGLSVQMLREAAKYLFSNYKEGIIIAFIKKENITSQKAFEKAGFIFVKELQINNYESLQYKLTRDES